MLSNTSHTIGWKTRDFNLQGIDGRTYSLAEVRGPKGSLVVFICNHCPYVKALVRLPNDTDSYPEDSFDNMKAFAAQHGFTFPYAIDTTQEVARAYDAQCTPDFFGFNAQEEFGSMLHA